MKRIPQAIISFMRDNVAGITARELAERVNSAFGTVYTADQIKSIKSNYKLKCGRKGGLHSGSASKTFPSEIRDYILANYSGVGPKEMTARLNGLFGTSYEKRQLSAYYKNHKLICGLTGRFEKGHTPANKGRKGYCPPGCEKGWFRKGEQSINHKPIGSERIDAKDGYVLIKTEEPNVYRLKHRVVWESVNGPVPDNCIVVFIDGDKLNTDISNLRLITRAENAIMNKNGLRAAGAELLETGLLAAKLRRTIAEKTKKRNAR